MMFHRVEETEGYQDHESDGGDDSEESEIGDDSQ